MADKRRNPAVKRRNPIAKLATLNGNVLGLTVGKKTDIYTIEGIPADFGVAFLVRKQVPEFDDSGITFAESEVYHVNVDPAGKRHICGCMGYLAHGHCKHVNGLYALLLEGRLPLPAGVKVLPALTSLRSLEPASPCDFKAA